LHKVAKKKQIILLGKVEVKDKKKAASAADRVAHELKKVDQADVKTAGARHNLDVGKQADKKMEEMKTSKLTTTVQNLDTAIDRAERKLSSLKNTQTEPAPNFDTKTASPEEMLKEKEKKVASATEQLVDEQKKETENLDSKIKAMKKVSRAGDQAESQVKADLAKGKQAQRATNVKQLKSAIKAVKKTTAEKMALQISKMTEVSDKSAQDQVEQAKATFQTKKDAVKKTAAQSGKGAATSIQETMINLEKQHQANILSIRGKMKERLSEKVRALKREMLSKEKLRIKKVEDVAGQGDKKKLTKGAESAKVATRTKLNKAKAQIQKWEVNVLAERRKAIVTRVQTTIKKLEESKRLTEDPQMKGVLKSQIQQVEDGGGKKIKKMKSKLRIETRQKIADTQATLLTRAAQESRARKLKKQAQQKKAKKEAKLAKERARDREVEVTTKAVDKTISMESKQEKKMAKDKLKIKSRIMARAKKKVKKEEKRLAGVAAKKMVKRIKQQDIFANPNATDAQKSSQKHGFVPHGLSNNSFISHIDSSIELQNYNNKVMTKAKEELTQRLAQYETEADASMVKRKAQIKAKVVAKEEKKRKSEKTVRKATEKFQNAQKETLKTSDFKQIVTIVDPLRAAKDKAVEDAKIAVEKEAEEAKSRKIAEKTSEVKRESRLAKKDSKRAEKAVNKAMKGDKKSFDVASKRLKAAEEQQKDLTKMRKKATERAEKQDMNEATNAASVIGVSPTDEAVQKATYAVERATDSHPVQKKR